MRHPSTGRRDAGAWPGAFVAVLAVIALVTTVCTRDDPAPTATDDGSDDTGPQRLTVVAVDYAFDAPLELEGGVIDLTFENRGEVPHELVLAGIGDTSMDRFLEDLRTGAFALTPEPVPEYLDQVAVPIYGLEGGSTGEATFRLSPGRYGLFCGMTDVPKGDEPTPHFELGMVRELTVTEGDAEEQLAEANGTITSFDYGFDLDIQAGDRTLTFMNDGPDQVHNSQIAVYRPGVGAEEAREAFAARLEGPVPGLPWARTIGSSGIYSAGLGSTFILNEPIRSGRTYVFACFVKDREGGPPHAIAYDMYEVVTIE